VLQARSTPASARTAPKLRSTPSRPTIGGGTAAFVGFLASDKIAIHFKGASVFKPDEGGPGPASGCLKLPEFKANAAATLKANCADACHAGGQPNARSAVNMTNLASANDAEVLVACNQIRTRINFQDLNNSGLYLAPTPGNMNHPFSFGGNQANFNAFKTAVQVWATAEQTAAP